VPSTNSWLVDVRSIIFLDECGRFKVRLEPVTGRRGREELLRWTLVITAAKFGPRSCCVLSPSPDAADRSGECGRFEGRLEPVTGCRSREEFLRRTLVITAAKFGSRSCCVLSPRPDAAGESTCIATSS
jgi:hypothetical protein